jgi:hypothetical protein
MTIDNAELATVRNEALQLIARLSVKSEVPAASFDPSGHPQAGGSEESKGGRRPTGTDRSDGKLTEQERIDRSSFAMKSHDHFVRRARGCRTVDDWNQVAVDAQAALDAWEIPKTAPLVTAGDSKFKPFLRNVLRENAKLPQTRRKSDEDIARENGVSRQYVSRIRHEMKEAA